MKAPFYQGICKGNVSERRNGTIWKKNKGLFSFRKHSVVDFLDGEKGRKRKGSRLRQSMGFLLAAALVFNTLPASGLAVSASGRKWGFVNITRSIRRTAAIWKHSRVSMSMEKNVIQPLQSVYIRIRTGVILKRRKQKQAQGRKCHSL